MQENMAFSRISSQLDQKPWNVGKNGGKEETIFVNKLKKQKVQKKINQKNMK